MKKAMVWGADGGIGRAVVRRLSADGWTTVAATRTPNADEIATFSCQANISNPYEVQAAVQAAAMEIETVDLWVYCAGDIVSTRAGDMAVDTWQRILDANLTGVYSTLHFSLPLLADDAHIVIVGAIHERLRLPGLSAYVAAKAGLEALAEALAKEERKRKVTIVRPSAVDTPFWEKVPFRMPPTALQPEQVAEAIVDAYRQGVTGRLCSGPRNLDSEMVRNKVLSHHAKTVQCDLQSSIVKRIPNHWLQTEGSNHRKTGDPLSFVYGTGARQTNRGLVAPRNQDEILG